MSVLTAEETKRVEAAIDQVERHTAAEIVVTTLKQSERYIDVRLWSVLAVALTSAALAHFIEPYWGVSQVLSLQFAAALVTWFGSGMPGVLRTLTPAQRKQEAAERAAELAFFEQGVFKTRDRTGVLILLSELEHKVVILGDEGIHARVQTSGWNELVAHLSARIHEHKPGDGLCDVIERLGKKLASHVPAEAENPNELDNRVRTPERESKQTLPGKPRGSKPGK